MNPSRVLTLADEAATIALGAALARAVPTDQLVSVALYGDLGAGKSTFARALLRAFGVTGAIKSPTYTLIESYDLGDRLAHHLDLYRIADPAELEYLGLADLWQSPALILVEWPERGAGALPPFDLEIRLSHQDPGRIVELRGAWVSGL